MSGKHQRRLWVLPMPTGSTHKYDRMNIGVGRAMSSIILIEHDTLIKITTSIRNFFDTMMRVFDSSPVSSASYSGGSGRILESPFKNHKKKSISDEIFKLKQISLFQSTKKKNIKLKVNSILENEIIVCNIKLKEEEKLNLNVNFLREIGDSKEEN